MPLAARHTLMSRTQLLGPMSLSAGLHTLCATQSGQTGLVPRPDLSGWGHSRDRERPARLLETPSPGVLLRAGPAHGVVGELPE